MALKNKQEFLDVICMRYGWKIDGTPACSVHAEGKA